jgi:hypothetical protein
VATAQPGGCDVVEDPELDARESRPLWLVDSAGLLTVRASDRLAPAAGPGFSLWRIPGRKHAALREGGLVLATHAGAMPLRALLEVSLADGSPYHCTVPLGTGLRGRLATFSAQARLVAGAPAAARARGVGRAALLHLRALQAIDAVHAGGHHRDVAEVLFGPAAVRQRWNADSELRAGVRHLLTRAEGLVRGGYLELAGLQRDSVAGVPGDEPGP